MLGEWVGRGGAGGGCRGWAVGAELEESRAGQQGCWRESGKAGLLGRELRGRAGAGGWGRAVIVGKAGGEGWDCRQGWRGGEG